MMICEKCNKVLFFASNMKVMYCSRCGETYDL